MEPPSFYKRPDRPALITPSASPPPLRVNVPPFLNHRGSSPPLKRQRMQSSTPLRTVHDAPSSSRTQTPVIDIQKEREASRSRLLDVWSSLAERYTRHIDEDDIVDLRTGKITRDNGVIRGSRPVAFGALAASGAGYQTADEGSDEDEDEREDKDAEEEDEDDEYGLDELDSFANPEDYGLETPDEVPVNLMAMPPPTLPFGPTDEADLQEFLDAERMRRNTCGTDVEDTEEADEEEETDFDHEQLGASEEEPCSVPSSDFVEDEADEDEEEDQEGPTPALQEDYYDQVVPLRYDSDEDELDIWKADDSNFTRPVSNPPENNLEEDTDDEIEFVEGPVSPKKSAHARPTNSSSLSKSHQKKNQQLLTPPLSSSSYAFSETPEPAATSSQLPIRSSSGSTKTSKKSAASVEAENSSTQKSRVEPSAKRASSKSRNESRSPTKPQPQSITKAPTVVDLSKKPKPFVLLTSRNTPSPTKPVSVTIASTEAGCAEDNANSSRAKLNKGKEKAKPEQQASSPTQYSRPSQDDSRGSSSPTKRKTRHDSPGPLVSHRVSSSPQSSPTKKPSRGPFDDSRNDKYRPAAPSKASVPPSQPRASSSREVLQHPSSPRNDTHQPTYTDASLYDPGPLPLTKKRKRVVSDTKSYSSDHEKPTQKHEEAKQKRGRSRSSHRTSDVPDTAHQSPQKRSTSQRRYLTPEHEYDGDPVSSSPSASESPSKHQRHRSRSRGRSQLSHYRPPPPPPLYGDGQHFSVSHPPLSSHPHSRSHSHSHSQPPPHLPDYPPIPDPRAQLIIANAMHQLSALMGGAWPQPPYSDSYIPHTPSSHRHHHERRQGSQMPLPPSGSYVTPSHRRPPEPYYDPDFSYATAPPDSPEAESSPSKSSPPQARRKAIVGRSRSRGRRLSFHFDEDTRERGREAMQESSPTRPPRKRGGTSGAAGARGEYSGSDEERRDSRHGSALGKGKGKQRSRARADTPAHGSVSASASDGGSHSEGESGHGDRYEHHQRGYTRGHGQRKEQSSAQYVRGQTPGPEFESSHTASHTPSGSSSRRQSSRLRR